MSDIPKFRLYGESDPNIEQGIRPQLPLRRWGELSDPEKQIALQELKNRGWVEDYSREIWATIEHLNHNYLNLCPGKRLHELKPSRFAGGDDAGQMCSAAAADFQDIFLHEKKDDLVLRMLSVLAQTYIDRGSYKEAENTSAEKERNENVKRAFKKFDVFANCLNHIFEQFAINQLVTRNGFVPRQDKKITKEIYVPTLKVLADPKWRPVNADLASMFEDYRNKNFPEAITKAHRVVQRFLQILVGEEGKSGKGELGKLFQIAKQKGIISSNRFTEPVMTAMLGYIPSERATKSTAKPAIKEATSSDALLLMNVVMILLQHCLQNIK